MAKPQTATVLRYPVLLTPDLEAGGYTVEVPDLPGCLTEGDSLEEALEMAKDAIQGYIASLKKHGDRVPEPSQVHMIEVPA